MNSEIIGSRIKAILVVKNIKRSYLAERLGITYNTLTKKLNGQREFGINEILSLKEILELDVETCANLLFNEDYFIAWNGQVQNIMY